MGRAGDSLDDEFPPRSGGGSFFTDRISLSGENGGPTGKIVVVVVECYCYLKNNYC